jgi:hypothetical protein
MVRSQGLLCEIDIKEERCVGADTGMYLFTASSSIVVARPKMSKIRVGKTQGYLDQIIDH